MNIEELKVLQLKIIKKNKTCNLIATIFILILLSISMVVFFTNEVQLQSIIMTIFFEVVIVIVIISVVKAIVNGKDIVLFNKNFKNIFVLKSLQNNFDNVVYTPETGFDKTFVDSVGMLNTADRYHSNDFISATYKNIKFQQSDVHIEEKHEERDSDGNTRTVWETLFRGRLMVFDFNKKFKANIQVSSSSFDAEKLPWGRKFSRVKMEDMEFNKIFYVYAQNEHEAFYILTPHFMEKMKEISRTLNYGIMFCFVDNKLYIALDNNQDSFEHNVLKVINEQEIEENITKDIKIITNFVDELDLDNNLFRKEV